MRISRFRLCAEKLSDRRLSAAAFLSVVLFICLMTATAALFGCGKKDTALTKAEGEAIAAISGAAGEDFRDITAEVLTKDRAKKFPALTKVYKSGELYAFISAPVAYNGPVSVAVVIDGANHKSVGVKILDHAETPHYVRDMDSGWFAERFAGKSAREYLRAARLTARYENEIIAITGATVTTEGIVNGVNAAFGAYQEYVLGEVAADAPYMVRFDPGEGNGPKETESLSFRAYGLILAEVSLEEIRTLPSVKRAMSIHSTAGVTKHEFRGTLLSNILEFIDPDLMEKYAWLMAIGVDDYISGISMDEVMAENAVYVMYEDNGEPLAKQNGEPGAMRVIVLNDFFGQRFTNYLLEIVLETKAPF